MPGQGDPSRGVRAFVPRQNRPRWIHSAKPPKGHIAHQPRPVTMINTKTRLNHTNQVIVVAKLSSKVATPKKPTRMTTQKRI